jgi:hypothetical protein
VRVIFLVSVDKKWPERNLWRPRPGRSERALLFEALGFSYRTSTLAPRHFRCSHRIRDCEKRIEHKSFPLSDSHAVYRYRKKSTDTGSIPAGGRSSNCRILGTYSITQSTDIGKVTLPDAGIFIEKGKLRAERRQRQTPVPGGAPLRFDGLSSRQDLEPFDAQPVSSPLPAGLHRNWTRTLFLTARKRHRPASLGLRRDEVGPRVCGLQ